MGEEGRRSERQYEIRMYGLLIIVLAAVFIAILLGGFFGYRMGNSSGYEDVKVEKPGYCSVDKVEGKIVITCNELDISADELCKVTSPGIKEHLKVVVIS